MYLAVRSQLRRQQTCTWICQKPWLRAGPQGCVMSCRIEPNELPLDVSHGCS
jgi:hypothetical protein